MEKNLFRLKDVSAKSIATRTWQEVRADDVFGRAAQLAYYFFLALFPFLICVVASLSVFGVADRGRILLFEMFARVLPPPAFVLVSQTFDQIIKSHGPLKMGVGIIVTLWSASMGMSAVIDTLNAAYRVKETRSLIKQYAVAIALTVGIAVLLVTAVLIVVSGETAAAALPPEHVALIAWKITEWPLGIGMLLLIFAITYYFAPDVVDRRWHWVSPGSVAGVILLALASVGLRIYLHYSGNSSATFGSLGAVIVLLLSFYLAALAVLSGGALNGVLERLAGEQVGMEPQPV